LCHPISYFNAALSGLEYGIDRNGDEYRNELNSVASTHILALDIDLENRVSYCGPAIIESKLVMLVGPTRLGTNVDSVLDSDAVLEAVQKNEAATAATGISFNGRNSIRADWEPFAPEVTKSLSKILQVEIAVNPNFDAVSSAMQTAAAKDSEIRSDWDHNLGSFMRDYFSGLESQLKSSDFHEDELLREGFTEAVSKNEVAFRIVEELKHSSYCEVVVEDGTLYLQTTAQRFGTNTGDIAEGLVDRL
jgi:hypothetical protein